MSVEGYINGLGGYMFFFKQQFLKTLKKKSHLFNSLMPEPAVGVPGRACRIISAWLQWGQGPGLVRKLKVSLGGRAQAVGGSLRVLLVRTAASCHQQKVGAQDAVNISLLGAWPSGERACTPGRLSRSEISYDHSDRIPALQPKSRWESPTFLKVLAASVALRVSHT